VLDGEKQRPAVGREARAGNLRAARAVEEAPRRTATGTARLRGIETVIEPGAFLAIGRDPHASLRIEGHVIRGGEPSVLGYRAGVASAVGGIRRIAAEEKKAPLAFGRRMVRLAVDERRHDLEDVPVPVGAARIGRIDLFRLASRVRGADDIDATGTGMRLDVLRPIHRRRAGEAGGASRLDDDVRLARETVR
jgi:hypothetical protein